MFTLISRHQINFSKAERRVIENALLGLADNSIDYTSSFENNFARYIGTRYAVSVPSARQALFAILKALSFKPGEEVILPAYSFWAVVEVVKSLGLIPVFAEIHADTYNLACASLKEKITARTRAIIVEHIFGQPADIDPLRHIARENNLVLIEDCAQACGSQYRNRMAGSFGEINYFSFAKGKNLTTLSGGMITTNDPGLYESIYGELTNGRKRLNQKSVSQLLFSGLMQHFITLNPVVYFPVAIAAGSLLGNNLQERPSSFIPQAVESSLCRLNNVLAHIGLLQLSRINQLNDKRIENTDILRRGLSGVAGIKLQKQREGIISTYSCFSIEIEAEKRDEFSRKLLLKGIDCRKDWMSYYLDDAKLKNLPKKILYLPNYPALDEQELFLIIAGVKDVIAGLNRR